METPVYHEMNRALREDDVKTLHICAGYISELRDCFYTE